MNCELCPAQAQNGGYCERHYRFLHYQKNKEKAKAQGAAWYAANKDRKAATRRAYYLANRDIAAAQSKAFYEANKKRLLTRQKQRKKETPEIFKRQWKDWLERNRPKARAACRKYQAQKRQATPAWANEFFIEEIYHLAELRTQFLGVEHEVDHIVPLQSDLVCGLHVEHNLQVITRDENIRKSNLSWPGMV